MIEEIDALVGDSLLAVLRQLRAGYPRRPAGFPHSVVLCGVRDYRIRSSAENAVIAGGSAFNVKAKSLRLGDFPREQTRALLAHHTAETGQAFIPDALDAVWNQTQGQPWLVNALAYETCFWNEAGRDCTRESTADEHWVGRFDYLEAGPQLLLQAFLQRVVNGSGRIEREYGLGRGRTDLLIVWPQGEATRRFVVECKVLHKSLEQTVRDGLAQTAAYMDRCGAEEGATSSCSTAPKASRGRTSCSAGRSR